MGQMVTRFSSRLTHVTTPVILLEKKDTFYFFKYSPLTLQHESCYQHIFRPSCRTSILKQTSFLSFFTPAHFLCVKVHRSHFAFNLEILSSLSQILQQRHCGGAVNYYESKKKTVLARPARLTIAIKLLFARPFWFYG